MTTSNPKALPIGTLLNQDRYQVQEVVHQGKNHFVYKGKDLRSRRIVAIKELYINNYCSREGFEVVLNKPEQSEHFENLIAKFALSDFDKQQYAHPNINKITDRFRENGTAYHISAFIFGQSLREVVKQTGHIPENQLLGIFFPILDTVALLHHHHLTHRNIKPDNILIDKRGIPYLTDISTIFFSAEEGDQDRVYNQGFSPLEAYLQPRVLTQASDIYSLGGVMYYCISGTLPTSAPDLVGNPLPPPTFFEPNITRTTEKAIMKALALKAEDRFQQVEDFFQALLTDKILSDNKLKRILKIINQGRALRMSKENQMRFHLKADDVLIGGAILLALLFILQLIFG